MRTGAVTAPTIELASTPGLVYAADPAGPYDPTVETNVVVTATVLDGFAWEGAASPSGFARGWARSVPPARGTASGGVAGRWTWVSPTEATFAVALAAHPPCPQIEWAAPQIVESECVDGQATAPSVEPVETEVSRRTRTPRDRRPPVIPSP